MTMVPYFNIRCADDPDLLETGLRKASKFANTTMLEVLKPFCSNIPVKLLDEMMEEAVLSDSEEAVTIVKNILRDHDHPLSVGIINTARSRGLVKIIKLLDTDYQDTTDQQKQSLIQAVSDRTASIQGKIKYSILTLYVN